MYIIIKLTDYGLIMHAELDYHIHLEAFYVYCDRYLVCVRSSFVCVIFFGMKQIFCFYRKLYFSFGGDDYGTDTSE